MANNLVVIGAQWGDEGKGKIVDWLTEDVRAVVRFQGGHNAGHTLVVNGKKTILRLVPSGVLHPQVHCYIGSGVVVSPKDLFQEIGELESQGVEVSSRITVAPTCPLILPYHRHMDMARENLRGENKIGTTGRGIGPAYEDKVARRSVRLVDLFDEDLVRRKVESNLSEYNRQFKHIYGVDELEPDAVLEELFSRAGDLKKLAGDVSVALHEHRAKGEKILFEGAQGTLLDVDYGTYPFVTSSNCLSGQAAAGSGVGPGFLDYALGIVKAYCTRVGSGPFPTELTCEIGTEIARRGAEFGSVTGRARRCGWFDAAALKRSAMLNGLTGLCVTKLDVLDELEEIKICSSYELDGKTVDILPFGAENVARARPVYETFPGWKGRSTAGARTWDELPDNARSYLKRLEELVGVRVAMISTGPDRDDTIVIDHPFR